MFKLDLILIIATIAGGIVAFISILVCLFKILKAAKTIIEPSRKDHIKIQSKIRKQHKKYSKTRTNEDWNGAPQLTSFFGRTKEIYELRKWILKDKCKLILLVGMAGTGKTSLSVRLGSGGIGKTDLSLKLAKGIRKNFDFVIWRKLLNAPLLEQTLKELIEITSGQKNIEIPKTEEDLIAIFIESLNNYRCLIIFDNFEAILTNGSDVPQYHAGYNGYGSLLKQIAIAQHKSCIILTSREKPVEIESLEGHKKPVRSLRLGGLNQEASKKIFLAIDRFSGSRKDWKEIIQLYNGNPLAMELAARHIKEVFAGKISKFLKVGKPIFSNLRELLDWHFSRLTKYEKEAMYWLAINREPVSFNELREDILSSEAKDRLSSTIQSLQRRLPIEFSNSDFTLQPVLVEYMTSLLIEQIDIEIQIQSPEVMQYVTKHLIEKVSNEVQQNNIDLLDKHALTKALSKDYVRESQRKLIMEPVCNRLLSTFGSKKAVELLLKEIIKKLQKRPNQVPGYAAGNILNLSSQLGIELKSFNFANLSIFQAHLQDVNLQNVNFTNCIISKTLFGQTFGNILSVKYSPDGKYLAAGDASYAIRLWQISNSQHIQSYFGHTDFVDCVSFSPDGNHIASGSNDHSIRIWNVFTGECKHILGKHSGRVRGTDFNIDGSLLVSGSEDGTVILWDAMNGKCIKVFDVNPEKIWSVAFSPIGDLIAAGSTNGFVRLWNLNLKNCKKIKHDNKCVRDVHFSPKGDKLVSGGDDHVIKGWNTQTGDCLFQFKGHNGRIRSVSFSPNGEFVASSSEDRQIKLWNISSGNCVRTLVGHQGWVRSISFNPNGKSLASGSEDQSIRIWEVSSGRCISRIKGYDNKVWSLAFDSKGKLLASGSEDHIVRIWNIDTGKCDKMLQGHRNRIWSVVFSPDDRFLASGSEDQSVKVWDTKSGKCLLNLPSHKNFVWPIAFSPCGKYIASGTGNTIFLWNIELRKCVHRFKGHSNWVRSIAFNPQGDDIVSGSDDQTIRIWSLTTGNTIHILNEHRGKVTSICYSPNGKNIASASDDQSIKIWDSTTGKNKHTIMCHSGKIWTIAYSKQGNVLVSGSEKGFVHIWDVETGNCIKVLKDREDDVWAVDISSDGKTVASGGNKENIRIWDRITGKCLHNLKLMRPYEGLNISGVTGISDVLKDELKSLGAVEKE